MGLKYGIQTAEPPVYRIKTEVINKVMSPDRRITPAIISELGTSDVQVEKRVEKDGPSSYVVTLPGSSPQMFPTYFQVLAAAYQWATRRADNPFKTPPLFVSGVDPTLEHIASLNGQIKEQLPITDVTQYDGRAYGLMQKIADFGIGNTGKLGNIIVVTHGRSEPLEVAHENLLKQTLKYAFGKHNPEKPEATICFPNCIARQVAPDNVAYGEVQSIKADIDPIFAQLEQALHAQVNFK